MLTLTFHNFQLVMCFFFPSFFEPERELQLQVFTVMITKQIIPILFTEACLTKAKNVSGVITPQFMLRGNDDEFNSSVARTPAGQVLIDKEK